MAGVFDKDFDPYKVLEVEPTATAAEIKKAYHKLAKKWHPNVHNAPTSNDSGRMSKEAAEEYLKPYEAKIKELNRAFELIGDKDIRTAYDAWAAAGKTTFTAGSGTGRPSGGASAGATGTGAGASGAGTRRSGGNRNPFEDIFYNYTTHDYRSDLQKMRDEVKTARGEGRQPDLSSYSYNYNYFEKEDFAGAKFSTDPRSKFMSSTYFVDCNLGKTDFTNARVSGGTFEGSDLSGAKFDEASLYETQLTGENLTNASFKGAELTDVEIKGQKVSNVDFTGAKLYSFFSSHTQHYSGKEYDGCTFDDAELYTDFKTTKFSNSSMKGIKVTSHRPDWSNAVFDKVDLTGSDLAKANLNGVKFINSKLDGANLGNTVNAHKAKYDGSSLKGTIMRFDDVAQADLSKAQREGLKVVGKEGKFIEVKFNEQGQLQKSWVEKVGGANISQRQGYAGVGVMGAGMIAWGIGNRSVQAKQQAGEQVTLKDRALQFVGAVTTAIGAALSLDAAMGSPLLRKMGTYRYSGNGQGFGR